MQRILVRIECAFDGLVQPADATTWLPQIIEDLRAHGLQVEVSTSSVLAFTPDDLPVVPTNGTRAEG